MTLIDFQQIKKKKEYTKENYYFPVPNAFMRNNELSLQEKSLFIYFNGFGDRCFQRQKIICDDLRITPTTLRKLMKSLEEKNCIYVQRKYSEKSKEKSTPIVFPIPLDEKTGMLTKHHKEIIEYLKEKYPSDY